MDDGDDTGPENEYLTSEYYRGGSSTEGVFSSFGRSNIDRTKYQECDEDDSEQSSDEIDEVSSVESDEDENVEMLAEKNN